MRIPKATFLVSFVLLLSFLVVVFAQKATSNSVPRRWLAVEIGLNTPMTVNAGTEAHALKAFWRIPASANSGSPYSAIKLEPKMVGDNVEVTVTVLSGDTSVVKSCKDWGLLKELRVTSYTLKEGEEVTVPQLSDLGPNFKNGKLTFKAVPSMATPQFAELEGGGGCGCTTCGSNQCCPNAGHCVNCPCGEVCC